MSKPTPHLGIIDWGIGGVSIYKLIKEKIGDVPIIYFSDTGVTPYGKMSKSELADRLDAVIEYLKKLGVTNVAIGCNAASTAIPDLKDHRLPVEGVIESALAATIKLKPTRLGLIGGRRTVLSGIYREAFRSNGIDVRQRIAQPLSGMIETGDISSGRLRSAARQILKPLTNCSHILLACTHYPAIVPVLRECVSPDTVFIDPAGALLGKIKKWDLPTGGDDRFMTTGDAEMMKNAAQMAFDVTISNPIQTVF